MKKELAEMAKKLERYQEYFDTREEEILKLRKENERLRNALLRFVDEATPLPKERGSGVMPAKSGTPLSPNEWFDHK